jgi:hypothetical protein
MTEEQRQDYNTNGYYDNACYNIARDVFSSMYKKGEQSDSKIKEATLN